MGEVIYMHEWKRRERLGRVPARTYLRRSRRGQDKGGNLTAGSVFTQQLLNSLRDLE